MKNKITQYINKLLGLFPQPLPVGVSAFNAFVDSIRNTYEMPTQDADSITYAIAASILRFGEKRAWASKYSFVLTLRAACAKQIAGQAFQDIKHRQQARQLAEEQSKAAATATKADDAQPLP